MDNRDNLRGIALMTLAMAGFATEDMFIKFASASLPSGQIMIVIGLGGLLGTGLWARALGLAVLDRASFTRTAAIRVAGEIIGATGFVTAIVLTTLSSVSAILQATPLLVAMGGALFLGERVGWRRWLAICIGLAGVLLIVRPGFGDFEPASLFAVMGAVGLAIRDLAIRAAPPAVHSLVMAAQGMAIFALTGAFLMLFSDGFAPIGQVEIGYLAAATLLGNFAYVAIIAAIRVGEVAIVTPFRYARLVFAMALGIVVLGERPDLLTWAGAALVIGSGLYTLYREQRQRRAANRAAIA